MRVGVRAVGVARLGELRRTGLGMLAERAALAGPGDGAAFGSGAGFGAGFSGGGAPRRVPQREYHEAKGPDGTLGFPPLWRASLGRPEPPAESEGAAGAAPADGGGDAAGLVAENRE